MPQNTYQSYFKSPIGTMELVATDVGLSSLIFLDKDITSDTITPPELRDAATQIKEYFEGKRTEFDLKLDIQGTEFQLTVWKKLIEIPYSETISYLQLAKRIGNVKAIRAVGTANGRNPISIITPCHRVIGSNGDLTGYGGGLWRKDWLLKLENKVSGRELFD